MGIKARRGPDRTPVPVLIVVAGGAVVGWALELLLRDADHVVRFLPESSLDKPGLLDGAHLLLLAPGLSPERRQALRVLVNGTPVASKIPILELVANAREAPVGVENLVPWPCRAEDLKRRIKAALIVGASQGGR